MNKLILGQYLVLMEKYLKRYWYLLAILMISIVSGNLLMLANPQILRNFIDSATGKAGNSIGFMATLFVANTLLIQMLKIGSDYLAVNIGWKATNALRGDLVMHCLKLDPAFHEAHTAGEITERIDGDVKGLSHFFSKFAVMLCSNLLLLAGVLVMLLREQRIIFLAFLLFTIGSFAIIIRLRHVGAGYWVNMREIHAEFYGGLSERLYAMEEIRANGGFPHVMNWFHSLIRKWLRINLKAHIIGDIISVVAIILMRSGVVLGLACSAYLWAIGKITVGTVLLVVQYASMIVNPTRMIIQKIQDLKVAGASIARISELFGLKATVQSGSGELEINGPLSVRFDNVSFRYDTVNVLNKVNFQLDKGDVLGLVGRTGSGKSTILSLLHRYYDPVEGTITLHNRSIKDLSIKNLRSHTGMVTQEVQLFNASIKDNVSLFNPAVPDHKVREVLLGVGLGNWLSRMPDGIHTHIHADGRQLSIGEAQLLALSRIFILDPGLVLLDEASSRLDLATEAKLSQAMDKLLHNRTAIIVAHGLYTVQRANKILVLEQGEVVEFGEREWLLSDANSKFYRLMQMWRGDACS